MLNHLTFKNRIAVLVNWSWNYVTYDHSARTLVESSPAGSEPASGRA